MLAGDLRDAALYSPAGLPVADDCLTCRPVVWCGGLLLQLVRPWILGEGGSPVSPHLIPAVVAGLLQGIVEWLPVSSKTMVTIYFALVGLKVQNAYSLGLIANFGSFFAAVYYFRREVAGVLGALAHPLSDAPYAKLLRFLFFGTLATGVIGVPLYVAMRHAFSMLGGDVAMGVIGILLLVTGFVVRRKEQLVARTGAEQATAADVHEGARAVLRKDPGLGAAILTGAMQGLAALPGISRSGMTITPLLWMGFDGDEAIRLSFMLDVLALLGAGIVPLVIGQGGSQAVSELGLGATVIMVAVATIVSFLAINVVLGLAKRLRTSVVTFGIAGLTILFAAFAVLHV